MLDKHPPEYFVDPISGDMHVHPRPELLARQPSTAGRVSALGKLHQELATATVLYESYQDHGKTGACFSLSAVIDYLTGQGLPFSALASLSALLAAIEDSKHGVQHPLIVVKRNGRPKKSNVEREFEQYLAAITEFCVRHIRQEGVRPFLLPASKLAAKLVNEAQLGVSVTASRLGRLRDDVSQLPIGSSGRAQFDLLLRPHADNVAPLECAKILLRHEWRPRPLPQVSE